MGRIILLLVMIAVLIVGGIVWFDYIGLIDAKSTLAPMYKMLGVKTRTAQPIRSDSPALLEEERYAKRLESVSSRQEELDQRSSDLDKRESEIGQKSQELDDRSKAIDDQEKSFNDKVKQYDNRKANIDQNAQYLTSMPPSSAVEILKAMDDQSVIDVFRSVEEKAKAAGTASLVSVWLAGMPADRSATLQRKMAEKPAPLE